MFAHFHTDVTRAAAILSVLSLTPSAASAGGPQTIHATYLPIEAMTQVLGSKSVEGYFVRKDGGCSVVLMVSEKFDPEAAARPSAARLRFVLKPGESAGLDSEEDRSLNVECGLEAATLSVTNGPRTEILALQVHRRPSLESEAAK